MRRTLPARMRKRVTVSAVVLALLYGIFYAFGCEIRRYDNIRWEVPAILPVFLRFTAAAVLLFFLLRWLLRFFLVRWQQSGRRNGRTGIVSGERISAGPVFQGRNRQQSRISGPLFLLMWMLFFLSFVPALLAYWPGIFSYDFPEKIRQVANGEITTHHPILDVLLHSALLNIGKSGSDCTVGALCSSVFQMLVLSGVFSYMVCFLKKERCPGVLRVTMVLLFLLLPVHALFAVNTVKDVLFSALFLLAFLFTMELVLHREAFFGSILMQVRYAAVLILMCQFRNTGIYIAAVFMVILTFQQKGHRFHTALIGAVTLAGILLVGSVLQNITDAESGSSSEALAVPIQQIARSYCEEPEAFSEKEKEQLFELIPKDHLEEYHSSLADDVKSGLHWESEEASAFIKFWFRKLPSFFGSYVNAFLSQTTPYWDPGLNYPDARIFHPYIETGIKKIDRNHVITRDTKSQAALHYYQMIAKGEGPEDWPVIGLLFRPAVYVWLLFLLLALAWCRRDRRIVPPAALLMINWLMLLLSPIALLRYAYPLMLCTPVLVCMLWIPEERKGE